ncbi:hypothetical protein CSOJ01_15035 [Colletotrichum sojae]|uniref:Uncharacterized protein n=1 Tax=Colletotrichum sojae TaxID=2175907 RepID=A0A8H6IP70_9PEZI|nr:hypothetical protein CSOJ01_15035 [Colletotrichum sojae]
MRLHTVEYEWQLAVVGAQAVIHHPRRRSFSTNNLPQDASSPLARKKRVRVHPRLFGLETGASSPRTPPNISSIARNIVKTPGSAWCDLFRDPGRLADSTGMRLHGFTSLAAIAAIVVVLRWRYCPLGPSGFSSATICNAMELQSRLLTDLR